MRIALCLEYDGSNFHGWQQNDSLRSVQGVVEEALSKIADEPISAICAGRTDAFVHALGQVIHFDTNAKRKNSEWLLGTNRYLPNDVVVKWAQNIDENFHARFSAIERHYRYVIYNHKIRPAILKNNLTWYYHHLDENKMAEASKFLLGEHDFSSFRGADCQAKTPIRKINLLEVKRQGKIIIIDIKANAFLHHMVRNIVGVLLSIGSLKKEVSFAKQVLEACDRKAGDITAKPHGLYLISVKYPSEFNIPNVDQELKIIGSITESMGN